ncbi:MAG: Mrp/NBP35 family ATP-binding protein [Chloroflexi bacterium]|nr:Mrp/NBP35 family ATP-binding protein [Chloroflexota bacterium]
MARKHRGIAADGGSDIVAQVVAQGDRLGSRMALVRHKIAVMSGKGGVGKSSITANLAAVLASQGYQVGILDADINGPAIAKMLGVRAQNLSLSENAILPALGPRSIKVMSMDLLLPGDKTPVIWEAPTQQNSFVWRGTIEASALREFLADTAWGELDFLLVDLPPGTYTFPTLEQLVPDLVGIIVTIPSEVSHLVVKRFISLAQELGTLLAGLVENMAGYTCPHCGKVGELFSAAGDGERMVAEMGISYLGSIPFDARLSASADWGIPFALEHGGSPAGQALAHVAAKVKEFVGESRR